MLPPLSGEAREHRGAADRLRARRGPPLPGRRRPRGPALLAARERRLPPGGAGLDLVRGQRQQPRGLPRRGGAERRVVGLDGRAMGAGAAGVAGAGCARGVAVLRVPAAGARV
jgi:hypothetical protein